MTKLNFQSIFLVFKIIAASKIDIFENKLICEPKMNNLNEKKNTLIQTFTSLLKIQSMQKKIIKYTLKKLIYSHPYI